MGSEGLGFILSVLADYPGLVFSCLCGSPGCLPSN